MTPTSSPIVSAQQNGPLQTPIIVEAPIGYFLKVFSDEIYDCGQSIPLENDIGMLTLIVNEPNILHLALQTNHEVKGFLLCHQDGSEQKVSPSQAPSGVPDDYAKLGEWWQVPKDDVKLESFVRLILSR